MNEKFDVKLYLEQYLFFKQLIDQKRRDIEELEWSKLSISGIDYTNDKVQHSVDDKIANLIAKLTDMKNEYLYQIELMLECKNEIETAISSLTNIRYKIILNYYYIDGLKMNKISEIMQYDIRHIRRLYSEALKEIETILHAESEEAQNEFTTKKAN